MAKEKERIVLGSGDVFWMEFDDTMVDKLPTDEIIEVEENKIGGISGGASIEYAAEFYTASDDMGRATKTIITKEEVLFKTGIMTLNAKNIEKLASTARIDDTTKVGHRVLKIGGVSNQKKKRNLIRFLQKDEIDGDIRITIVGSNAKGFTLAFAKDKETVVDAEFKALPNLDKEGTLVIYDEKIVTSESGGA